MPARTVYLIKRIETEITLRMNKVLSEYGITLAQYIILNFVNDNQKDLSSAQLSRRFKMTPQSMNETVTTLQKKEMLVKNIDTENKRILRISLTEKGVEVLSFCNAAIDTLEQNLFENVSTDDLASFRKVIGTVLETTRQI
jgi:DNA-binding MarR family transcriptional regulator